MTSHVSIETLRAFAEAIGIGQCVRVARADDETWTTCPRCLRQQQVATMPGIVHLTRVCHTCEDRDDR